MQAKHGIPIDKQYYLFAGRKLEDDVTMIAADLIKETCANRVNVLVVGLAANQPRVCLCSCDPRHAQVWKSARWDTSNIDREWSSRCKRRNS